MNRQRGANGQPNNRNRLQAAQAAMDMVAFTERLLRKRQGDDCEAELNISARRPWIATPEADSR